MLNEPNLTWNVYRYNVNKNEIYIYNVFDNYRFYCDVMTTFRVYKDKYEFSEELRKDVAYYFWCKAEHEVVVTSFPPYVSKKEAKRIQKEDFNIRTHVNLDNAIKVDIYSQIRLNWDRFVDYVWNELTSLKGED